MMDHRTAYEIEILLLLSESGGYITRDVARRLNTPFNPYKRSQQVRNALLVMKDAGLVAKMDNLKPDCWIRTPAGSRVVLKMQTTTEGTSP